ncbi:hypothetical protein GYA13_03590 [Candidatus Kuenenbacteria bacterium]|nr:hypothetical protein [Candidatus Kuenenbacteria bacterium]
MEMNEGQNLEPEVNPRKKWWPWLIALTLIILMVVAGSIAWKPGEKEPANQNGQPSTGAQLDVRDPEKEAAQGRLFLEISGAEIKKGETFTVAVYGDTLGHDMSAVGFILLFDQEQLELVGKADFGETVMTMGAIERKGEGEIEIVRGQPGDGDWKDSDDGFNGTKGLLAKLTFLAKGAGEGEINFQEDKDGGLILDDARGTTVKMSYTGAKYLIK